MKIAIISDIHGNLEAFQNVLADIDRSNVDATISLGDHIGYGPDPEKVIQLVYKREMPSLLGNHELVVLDEDHLNWFNPTAQKSLIITIELLSQPSIEFIRQMPHSMVQYGGRFVHGFPPDSTTLYLFQISDPELIKTFKNMDEQICFVGHTHELVLIEFDGHGLTRTPLQKGITSLQQNNQYIVNVGSVGQPRDGNNCAKYVVWDSAKNCIEIRYVAYDIAAVAAGIKARGMPQSHANRLW